MTTMSLLRSFLLSAILLCCIFDSSFLKIDALVAGLSACRPSQIRALMEFKSEFDFCGCNQSDFVSGVGCNNVTGAVTKLQVPSGCLSGTLKPNSSLFKLHHLRYLDLAFNDFTSSSLPSGFGNLNKLEVLSLSSNGFMGQIPSSISNLSMLSSLDLSQNKFTGSFPLLWNLSKLDLLFLGGNNFEGQILEPISKSKLITLRLLDLSFLNISHPIDLSFLSSLKSLWFLRLSGNSISPASLSSDSGIPLNLERLVLSDCNVSEFPNILKPLQSLMFLELSNNMIKGKVPAWLWKLPRLISVSLANNSFTDLEGTPEVLVNSSLQFLDLALNHFKGPFPKPPLSINVLSAWNNSFTGNIPLSICDRSSLTNLDLSYNNFSGPIPRCLGNLKVLNLRKNRLEGSLPDMFSAGASLRTLDVGYNRLTGKLPKSLLNCSSLNFVTLDHNRIKDTFPFWLKALPNLQVLTLRSNKFYGPISPPDQGPLAFPELHIFEISDNNFAGSLAPNYFVNWKASLLQTDENGRIYMGYDNNPTSAYEDTIDLQCKGLFMEQGKVFTSYATIDFSGNRIEGQIPESIGLLKALIALNLSNNAFTGHIPLSLENLKELESLDLSRNQLSGSIPKGLGSLSFLAYMDVSRNQLKGEIPQGTQITGQPKSSFEGNAGLCGLPLEESCFGTTAPPIQQQKQEDEEEEEQVLNWKAVAIGYAPGVLLGLAIAQVIASYKPEWLVKIIGPNKRRNR